MKGMRKEPEKRKRMRGRKSLQTQTELGKNFGGR